MAFALYQTNRALEPGFRQPKKKRALQLDIKRRSFTTASDRPMDWIDVALFGLAAAIGSQMMFDAAFVLLR